MASNVVTVGFNVDIAGDSEAMARLGPLSRGDTIRGVALLITADTLQTNATECLFTAGMFAEHPAVADVFNQRNGRYFTGPSAGVAGPGAPSSVIVPVRDVTQFWFPINYRHEGDESLRFFAAQIYTPSSPVVNHVGSMWIDWYPGTERQRRSADVS